MKYYISKTKNPYFNLAMEEYLMKNIEDEVFYIYINDPSVIIGKNQNPYTEVGIEYIKENDIKLVRRLSGGGAVYHDNGNINYAFIMPGHAENLYQFQKYSMPIVDSLKKNFDLNVEFSGRNDLIIDEKKISGSAQYVVDHRLLHHGTLLYNVDFSNVSKILLPNDDKLKSKGVKSVASRVSNLVGFEGDWENVNPQKIVETLIGDIANDLEFVFTDEQIKEIEVIAEANAKSVAFILENKKSYENHYVEYIPGFGTIEVYSNLEDGKIKELEIFGEYFFKDDLNKIKMDIVGTEFTKEAVSSFIEGIKNFENYFHRLTKEKLVSIIMGE